MKFLTLPLTKKKKRKKEKKKKKKTDEQKHNPTSKTFLKLLKNLY